MKRSILTIAVFLLYAHLYSQEVIGSTEYTNCKECVKEVCVNWEIVKKENPDKLMKQYQKLYLKVHLNTDALLLGEFKLRYKVSNDIAGNYSNEKTISIPLYTLEQFMEAHEKEFYMGEAFFGYTKDLKTLLVCDPDPNEEKVRKKNEFISEETGWEEVVSETKAGKFTDSRNGKTYKTVKIGNQTMFAENLNYNAGNGSWCYDNNSGNCNKYGRLYDWKTAKTVCPSGWHLPSDAEWSTLTNFVGSDAGKKLKSTTGWNSSGNGIDAYGFTALPGGYRDDDGPFDAVGDYGYWWSSTEDDTTSAYTRGVYYDGSDVYRDDDGKGYGFSVRCVRDF